MIPGDDQIGFGRDGCSDDDIVIRIGDEARYRDRFD
jgi:hypothetical protein